MSERILDISLTVNGERVSERVEARKTLVDFLREDLALTGSHVGCEHGVCGACTVRVDGEIVRGCLMLAVQCDGSTVETIEGMSDSGEIADLQAAFEQRNALQCGFCTPGMVLTAQDLLKRGTVPSRDEIREQEQAFRLGLARRHDPMHGPARQRPFRQHDHQLLCRERVTRDEFGQNTEADPGYERREHRFAIIDAKRTRGPHGRYLS